jgi:hypothetical protein
MPKFVILRHDRPRGVHFDFMLEAGSVLKTWALPQPPELEVEMDCGALGDHRIAYLDYEGPVSGNRGTVLRWDRGEYAVLCQSETEWIVTLRGEKFAGRATLRRLPDDPARWHASFAKP